MSSPSDVNPRALAYTALNAALNGLANVECRDGSFFDPAGDEKFDLITCNAPFVVSPEQRWATATARSTATTSPRTSSGGAGERLGRGGYATLLGSWLVKDEDGCRRTRPVVGEGDRLRRVDPHLDRDDALEHA